MFNAQQRARFHPYLNNNNGQRQHQQNNAPQQARGLRQNPAPPQVPGPHFDAFGHQLNPGQYGNVTNFDNLYGFPGQLRRPLPTHFDFQREGKFIPPPQLARIYNHPGYQYTRNKIYDKNNTDQKKSDQFTFSSFMPAALPQTLPDVMTTAKGGPLTATESFFTMQNVQNSSQSKKEYAHAMRMKIAKGPTVEHKHEDFIMKFLMENHGFDHNNLYTANTNWQLVTTHHPDVEKAKDFTMRKNVKEVKSYVGGLLHSKKFEQVNPFSRTKVIGQLFALYNLTDVVDINSKLIEHFGTVLNLLEPAITHHIQQVNPQLDISEFDFPRFFKPLFDILTMLGRSQRIGLRQVDLLEKMFSKHTNDFELMKLILEIKKRFYIKHDNDKTYDSFQNTCAKVDATTDLPSFVVPWRPHQLQFSTAATEDKQYYRNKISVAELRLATKAFMAEANKSVFSLPVSEKSLPKKQAPGNPLLEPTTQQ